MMDDGTHAILSIPSHNTRAKAEVDQRGGTKKPWGAQTGLTGEIPVAGGGGK